MERGGGQEISDIFLQEGRGGKLISDFFMTKGVGVCCIFLLSD